MSGKPRSGTSSNRGSRSKDDSQDSLRAALRQFVRTKGEKYLSDANVTSVGIGYKVKNGVPTTQLAIQFTVDRKASAPEALAEMDTVALPESIEVDGTTVPTDVLERRYAPAFKVVGEPVVAQRKVRLDPIVPGISVANEHISAGTIGAIVHDAADGTPYVLSNWHVLHGPDGRLGDVVTQPGSHDDNRISRNRLGTLVRSHLGPAGDCAVASIEDRDFDPEILELAATPTQLGDPDLGDKVVKSGRTTGVTHGLVRRVDVLVTLDYGGAVGEKNIGGIEIGPDPDNPAPDGEISQGGDSGALWVISGGDTTAAVMAGLHFGGETADSPDEHALACLPASVFEKLQISLTPPAPEQLEAATATGYDPDFLDERIDVPKPGPKITKDLARTVDGDTLVEHTHFSLQMSKSRHFARWVAWNIDGGSLKTLSRRGIEFVKDPQLGSDDQVGDELYRDNDLDRGHIARRADLLWGPISVAKKANIDSFYFSNITPQMNDFNQSTKGGVWGELEDAVFADVDVDDLRVTVFGGPVFQADDRTYRGVALPREYWKVLAFRDGGELKARAFLLTQALDQLESLELDEFRVFQVPLKEIEDRTALRFPDKLRAADTKIATEALEDRRPLARAEDIRW